MSRREHDEETIFQYSDCTGALPDAAAHGGVLAINSDGEVMLNTGTYYLAQSISVSNINIVGDVILCLNGYDIEATNGYGIYIKDGVQLTLCEYKNSGSITRGSDNGKPFQRRWSVCWV